jgi:hypothetical protein
MPQRKRSNSAASAIREVRRKAGSAFARLRRDIRSVENELVQLRRDEEMLVQLAGGRVQRRTGGGRTRTALGGNVPSGRINWKNVLAQLPNQFKAANVRQVRGLADKRPSEIFAGITRWIEAGSVKRKARGQYEKRRHEPSSVRPSSKPKRKAARR